MCDGGCGAGGVWMNLTKEKNTKVCIKYTEELQSIQKCFSTFSASSPAKQRKTFYE